MRNEHLIRTFSIVAHLIVFVIAQWVLWCLRSVNAWESSSIAEQVSALTVRVAMLPESQRMMFPAPAADGKARSSNDCMIYIIEKVSVLYSSQDPCWEGIVYDQK